MASFSRRVCVFSAFLVLFGISGVVRGDDSKDADDGVTVETEEDDQYHSPRVDAQKVYLAEHFDDVTAFNKKWIKSEAKKQGVDENIAKYDGRWEVLSPSRKILKNDLGLVLTTEAKHAAISALLDRPFEFKGQPLVVQYEVTMQDGQNCGGAYIKLLSRGTNSKADLRKFYDQTPYTIMFGPDKCGNDNKLHFIFRHQNPKNGVIEEKHSKKPSQRLEEIYKDKEPHLYTLVVNPDNTFKILVDDKEVNSGSLLEDFTPPVNPPEEIDDPNDKKPDDWDEREKIVDPTATKPEDWDESEPAQIADPNAVKPDGWLDDEPEMIPDPDAQKPADWDEEMDGEWEAPLIDNPACAAAAGCGPWLPPLIPNPEYKGIWRAPLVSNPNYRGKWTPSRIRNPDYFNDEKPYAMTPIHAVGFELWSMSPMLLFDNLIITDDINVADEWARNTFWMKRSKISSDSDSVFESALKYAGQNPWVYAVAIVVAFIVVGLITYLCLASTPEADVDVKKTDAVTEDDPHQSEGEHSDRDEEPERGGAGAGKADLEGPGPAPPPAPERDQDSEVDPGTEQEELDDNVHSTTEEKPLVDTDGAGDGQRKRKPRKE